jgi:hypothetical protein
MTTAHKILGWVEEVTACDCCGKSPLKGTFACDLDGEIVHYGSTCVTRNTGVKNPTSAATAYLRERSDAAKVEARQSDEYRALRARFAERERMNFAPGSEAAAFVRDHSRAFDLVASAIATRFDVPFSTVRCA